MRIKLLALLGLSLVACRGEGGGDQPLADSPSGVVTIQEIQNDEMAKGAPVELRGVVVTAIDKFGNKTGDLWVEDPAGGPFSGIKVFRAPLDQVSVLAVGDLIDIENAEKDEFKFGNDTGSTTEIKGRAGGLMTLTKVGTGAVPAPGTVDAVALSLMDQAAAAAEWEKWEGVLVTVTKARQVAATGPFGSSPAPDTNEFRISGFARVQSIMTELPDTSIFGVCYDKITGVGDHFFNDLILPRSADDLVGGGAGCRPIANNVVELQTGTSVESVGLTDVFVTAIDDVGTSKGFWVSDALVAAPNSGVLAFTGSSLPPNIAIGAKVTFQGGTQEFDVGSTQMGDRLTEVTGIGTVTIVAQPGAAPTPLAGDPAVLGNIGAPGEPFEGVLVSVPKMKVMSVVGTEKRYELKSNAGATLYMDDDAFAVTPPAVGDCLNVVGVMSVQLTADVRTINPRMAADVTPATGCTATSSR